MERQQTIWSPSRAAATGRPAQRSRSDIVAAAIAVAERDGLAAVTMRRVATELGTGAASLYRHLGSRDDLLDLMIDQVLADYLPPDPNGDPHDDVVADLLARLRFIRGHRWLIDALEERPALSPQRIRLIELSLERLADHPAPGPAKIEAITVAAGMLSIQARHENAGRTLDPVVAQAQIELLQQAAGDGAHPHLAAAMSQPPPTSAEPGDDRFARVLRGMLAGLLAGGGDNS
jgi:AcrR family transcriptional regulator